MITDYFFDERLRVKYGKIAEEKFGSKFHFYPDDKEEFEEYDKNLKIFKYLFSLGDEARIYLWNSIASAFLFDDIYKNIERNDLTKEEFAFFENIMIVTKSISRFARNTLDCISYVRRLKALKPPVGVFFEMNGYNTLDTISETFLTLLSTVAQGESEAKSEALKWSYRQRFKKGIPVNNMWAIMGYDTDENGKIFIIEKEAEIVRFMFTAYLEGKSTVEIAEALTMAEIPTPKGNVRWQPGTVAGMLHNEKYCGEMRMQKTVTVDLFSHKSVKNEGIVSQYRMKNYHPAIVSRKVYEDVQERFIDGGNRARHTKEPKIKVKFKPIKSGLLTGFVPIPSAVEKIDIEQLKEISKKQKSRRKQKC